MYRAATLAQAASVGTGLLVLAFGCGFALRVPWVVQTWPWPDGALSYLFVGSILGAVAIALIWIGMVGEWGAMAAGGVTASVMAGGIAVFLAELSGQPGRGGLAPYVVWFAVVALLGVAIFVWCRRIPIRDVRTLPWPLRVSYAVFGSVLLLAGTALVLRLPTIFPWPLKPESSVLFGWIFYGDACYYLYALLIPRWHHARGQLLSFLVYDLFLIPSFLGLFATVKPDHWRSLALYMLVLVYSGLLALYYLFLNPTTRGWRIQESWSGAA